MAATLCACPVSKVPVTAMGEPVLSETLPQALSPSTFLGTVRCSNGLSKGAQSKGLCRRAPRSPLCAVPRYGKGKRKG